MKLVTDTNVLMPFFWKNSKTRKIIIGNGFELIAPEFALEEINKYKKEIMKKAGISEEEFKNLRIDLAVYVNFLSIKKYKKFLKKSLDISPDEKDIDFFAVALKFKCPLWSNDKDLKKQNEIKIYSTEEIIKFGA